MFRKFTFYDILPEVMNSHKKVNDHLANVAIVQIIQIFVSSDIHPKEMIDLTEELQQKNQFQYKSHSLKILNFKF
jgi:hypothetical protein